jgi:predicted transcriptional regulator
MDDFMTAEEAAVELGLTRRRIHRMIAEDGKFPGARKLNPSGKSSAVIIPCKEIAAEKKRRALAARSALTEQKKRAQAVEA